MRERTILVVDDDEGIREMLRDVLEFAGYVVYDGEDGWALGAALKHRPDCILLDMIMPHPWTGWEMRRRLLDQPTTAAIPVVLMTALDSSPQWREDLRVAAVMQKPFDIDEMLAAVAAAIAEKEKDSGGE